MNFKDYLKKKHYQSSTISQFEKHLGLFFDWLLENDYTAEQLTYTRLLDFITFSREKGKTPENMNRMLKSIETWYQYKGSVNPVKGLRIKGTKQSLPVNLLTKEELTDLYITYQPTDNRTQRNKRILSLLIYQAITNEELHTLKPEYIKLREGKIYIPKTATGKERILNLEANQILELQEYLTTIRPQMLAQVTKQRPGRKPPTINHEMIIDKLFFSENGSPNLKNSLQHLFKALQKINPKIENLTQIRQSVITQWLREKDLRMTQYMAGHGHVMSTERYKRADTEDLSQALQHYHPLK